jgi:hypothetical protein
MAVTLQTPTHMDAPLAQNVQGYFTEQQLSAIAMATIQDTPQFEVVKIAGLNILLAKQ